MIICGIDPGLSGAVAFMDGGTGDILNIADMPTLALSRGGKNKREVDPHGLADLLRAQRIGHAFVELVGAMPGQGVSSMFAFGKAFGIVIGVASAIGIPMSFVSSRKWKPALSVPASKDGARARASQLLPGGTGYWPLVKHDGRAEAALIALYGVRSLVPLGSAA